MICMKPICALHDRAHANTIREVWTVSNVIPNVIILLARVELSSHCTRMCIPTMQFTPEEATSGQLGSKILLLPHT